MRPFSCLLKYSPCLAALTVPSYPQAGTLTSLKQQLPATPLQPPRLRTRQRALSFGSLGFSAPQLAGQSKGSAKKGARFRRAGKMAMSDEVDGAVGLGPTPFSGVTSPPAASSSRRACSSQHTRRPRCSTTRASSFASPPAAWPIDSAPSSRDAARPRATAPPSAVSPRFPPSPRRRDRRTAVMATGVLPAFINARWGPF
ncbi:hypothetical protein OF83DRAFT_1172767 [Amylostereum chailletii]|nr:hypothetical protein OF83DRAFT_1172767 [Amylostereum chailletii]